MQGPHFVDPGTHLFRFLDHRRDYFWPTIRDMLSEQKLYLNSRTRFNDAYDSRPQIHDDLSPSTVRRHAAGLFRNPWHHTHDTSVIPQILNLKQRGNIRLNKKQINNIKIETQGNATDFLDQCGLLSFSLTGNNRLLWALYAAGSSGVCAVFRRGTSMQSALCLCARVLYVEQLPRLPLSLLFEMVRVQRSGEPSTDPEDQVFSLSFLHKDQAWQHEYEARIFYPFRASKKVQFDRDEMVAIILGPKSPPELETRLRSAVAELAPSVPIQRASLSPSGFEIILPEPFVDIAVPHAA
jgi:hypothetical protein